MGEPVKHPGVCCSPQVLGYRGDLSGTGSIPLCTGGFGKVGWEKAFSQGIESPLEVRGC